MEILCIGLNHRTAPVGVREKFAISAENLAGEGEWVWELDGAAEALALSTCNRTEYYLAGSGERMAEALMSALERGRGLSREELDAFYLRNGRDVARHLFRVVGGLDSMVLGETEIFGQVKKSYAAAHDAGLTGGVLNRLFQRAFAVGKRLRRETSIQEGATSVGGVAVELAEKIFGHLSESTVMLLGAGEMSRATAQCLLSRGAGRLLVANRSYDRAAALAGEMGGEAVEFGAWESALEDADVVIASTGAPHAVIRREAVERVRRARKFRCLFMIDIAVPRDIEPEVGEIDEVYLYDIDMLEQIAGESRKRRHAQITECEKIIEDELGKFSLPAVRGHSVGALPGVLNVGTRGSALALAQAALTEEALSEAFPRIKVVRRVIRTTGDRRTDIPLAQLAVAEGGMDKGLFVKELELALASGKIDLAVHSLKDVPTVLAPEFEIAAVLPRAPAGDVLVARQPGGLAALPDGAVVGTSSVRRAMQLRWLRPGLRVADIRGNVPTRLSKLAGGGFDAIMLAEAGLRRLGFPVSEPIVLDGATLHPAVLDDREFLPAAGQGAIGFEIRSDDKTTAEILHTLNHHPTWMRVRAEREFLKLLDAGCHTPVGVRTDWSGERLAISARVFPDHGGAPRCGAVEGDPEAPEAAAKALFDSLK